MLTKWKDIYLEPINEEIEQIKDGKFDELSHEYEYMYRRIMARDYLK